MRPGNVCGAGLVRATPVPVRNQRLAGLAIVAKQTLRYRPWVALDLKLVGLLLLVFTSGCFDPQIPRGILCGPNQECPPDQECRPDGRCDVPGGADGDASAPDNDAAAPDADGLDAYLVALIDAYCDMEVRCGVHVDPSACKIQIASLGQVIAGGVGLDNAYLWPELIIGTRAGRLHYDAAAAQQCLLVLNTVECSYSAFRAHADVCEAVFRPRVAPGGTCFTSAECTSAICSRPCHSDQCCEGGCTGQALRDENEDCIAAPCKTGMYCKPDPDGKLSWCTRWITAGSPCEVGFAGCAAGLTCRPQGDSGICARASVQGEPCSTEYPQTCDFSTQACNAMTLTCQPRRQVGESCAVAHPFPSDCALYAFCSVDNTCKVRGRPGEDCNGVNCEDGTICGPASLCVTQPPQPTCP